MDSSNGFFTKYRKHSAKSRLGIAILATCCVFFIMYCFRLLVTKNHAAAAKESWVVSVNKQILTKFQLSSTVTPPNNPIPSPILNQPNVSQKPFINKQNHKNIQQSKHHSGNEKKNGPNKKTAITNKRTKSQWKPTKGGVAADVWRKKHPKENDRSGCRPEICKLPKCYCSGFNGPSNLKESEMPQMVMVTFDDAVNKNVYDYINMLNPKPRWNPNGCAVSYTFFCSDTWSNGVGNGTTDYKLVRKLYDSGHEIASHGLSHRFPPDWWTNNATLKDFYGEFSGQRNNIHTKSGVPKTAINGMRIPFLSLGGDKPFQMIADVGMLYESTTITGPDDYGGVWPYTLDYPMTKAYCMQNNCPKGKHPGIWEVPLNQWFGPTADDICSMADSCGAQPKDITVTLKYLWDNFNRFYRRNRAPFGIHIHARWFADNVIYVDALREFLDQITKLDDVYLVSPTQIIHWIQQPTPIKDLTQFKPWRRVCSGDLSSNSGR